VFTFGDSLIHRHKKCKEALAKNIGIVKDVLQELEITQDFFIAGGSVFSAIKNNSAYLDIDVYFYEDTKFITEMQYKISRLCDESDRINILASTDNAITLKVQQQSSVVPLGSIDVQLIIRDFGSIDQVLSQFDINYSMCAVTSQGELIRKFDIDDSIEMSLKNFRTGSSRRYSKYVVEKGGTDLDKKQQKKIIDFLLQDIFTELPQAYDGFKLTKLQELSSLLANNSKTTKLLNSVHNSLVEMYSPEDLLSIFELLWKNFAGTAIDMCDECWLMIFVQSNTQIVGGERKERVKNKYPEYFL
jgi:hypothetical protein